MSDAIAAINEASSRDEKIAELAQITAEIDEYRRFNQLLFYKPYPKQALFHRLGGTFRERMLMAGNQVGKTLCAGAEVAIHTTGLYPADWDGYVLSEPSYWWVAGVTGESTRDNPQRILMGRKREYGTGMIPRDSIIGKPTLARGVPDLLDSVEIRHQPTGGVSIIWFKSYEKGREKAQGETLHGGWPDEEPPLDWYTEFLTRTNAKRGPIMLTFTPLKGMSQVVSRFLGVGDTNRPAEDASPEELDALKEMAALDLEVAQDQDSGKLSGRTYVQMELKDAAHYDADDIAEIESSYPEHEREARTKGVPMLGSGRVYPVTETSIKFSMMDFQDGFPPYWRQLCAVDFSDWDHPTAGVWIRYDMDSQTVYVYDVYRRSKETLAVHASAFKKRGEGIPTAWPHDGHKHDGRSGKPISELWKKEGVKMLKEHAQHEDGSISVQAGIDKILDMMKTGRFKVADHLADWWEEFRLYHRKDGKIVKEMDDLMDATRYAVVSLKFARRPVSTHMRNQTVRTTLDDYDVLS